MAWKFSAGFLTCERHEHEFRPGQRRESQPGRVRLLSTPDYEAVSPALVSSNGQFAAAFICPFPWPSAIHFTS